MDNQSVNMIVSVPANTFITINSYLYALLHQQHNLHTTFPWWLTSHHLGPCFLTLSPWISLPCYYSVYQSCGHRLSDLLINYSSGHFWCPKNLPWVGVEVMDKAPAWAVGVWPGLGRGSILHRFDWQTEGRSWSQRGTCQALSKSD